jgi:hypothetical protein
MACADRPAARGEPIPGAGRGRRAESHRHKCCSSHGMSSFQLRGRALTAETFSCPVSVGGGYAPGPPSMITARRLRGSLTPSAVGTASSDFPTPEASISFAGTPSAMSAFRTALARRSERR